MNYNVGDFIKTNLSNFPSLIVKKEKDNNLLVTLHEYKGDYVWVNKNIAIPLSLKPEEELSIILNYEKWFIEYHKNLFQEILLKNIKK